MTTPPKVRANAIPAELRKRSQWVLWRLEQRDGKETKVPYRTAEPARRASSTDPATWASFAEALKSVVHADGLGYVFAADDPYVGVDLDRCAEDRDGLHATAAAIVSTLASYTEWSVSGSGVHVIVRAELNGDRNRIGKTPWEGDFETYSSARFFCVTGDHLVGAPTTIEHRQDELDALLVQMFPPAAKAERPPVLLPPLDVDDEELLERARAAKNGIFFDALYGGDWAGYGSQSEADLGLCGLLAFWTGPDPARIDRLFRRSGLYRLKWDQRRGDSSYGADTITRALAGRTDYWRGPGGRRREAPRTSRTQIEPRDDEHGREQEQPAALPDRELDDVGNAARFVDANAPLVRFVPAFARWFCWDGARLAEDETREVERRAKETVRALLEEASREPNDYRRGELVKHANRSASAQRLAGLLKVAESDPRVVLRPAELDADPYALNTANGVVDLRSGSLRPHVPGEPVTMVTGAAYDPDAPAPRWQAHLERCLVEQELIAFLQRLCGLAAIGLVREHLLAILHGSGANGKTVTINALVGALGDYAHASTLDLLLQGGRSAGRATEELASLRGRRLVSVSESPEDGQLAVERVKWITGGDPITARRLYGHYYTFEPSHTVFLLTNHRPRVGDDGNAIWRRIILLPFGQTIPEDEQDPTLGDKLACERPGILAWIVQGTIAYLRDGLNLPDAVTSATSDYRRDEDVFGQFLDERAILEPEASAQASAIRATYIAWAGEHGASDLSHNALAERLGARGFQRRRGKTGARWYGLRLREPDSLDG